MASFLNVAVVLLLHLLISGQTTSATWCVARADVSEDSLQAALDYACGAGADCTPIQESGPCFLPNTVQAHASYAFNSYYMHAAMDPVACVFSGTASVAKTDPSYGSCVYPASPSTAKGNGVMSTPVSGQQPPLQNGAPLGGNGGPLTPGDMNGAPLNATGGALTPTTMGPSMDDAPSRAVSGFPISNLLFMEMMFVIFLFMI